jgi:MFS family permease
MGVVQNYAGLLITRLFLGVAGEYPDEPEPGAVVANKPYLPEAGLYPGAAYYITLWYPRHRAQYRQALFFSAASIAGAFSGILAYGIAVGIFFSRL